MAKCYFCGKEAGTGHGNYIRRFCNSKCQKSYRVEMGITVYTRQSCQEPIGKYDRRTTLLKKAREGNLAAQTFLRAAEGVRGLWNPQTKKMVRF